MKVLGRGQRAVAEKESKSLFKDCLSGSVIVENGFPETCLNQQDL